MPNGKIHQGDLLHPIEDTQRTCFEGMMPWIELCLCQKAQPPSHLTRQSNAGKVYERVASFMRAETTAGGVNSMRGQGHRGSPTINNEEKNRTTRYTILMIVTKPRRSVGTFFRVFTK